jgi:alpha-beta hydrolase superfamily lysophospholipase
MATVPDTIVLVHGLWTVLRSWEEWVPYYEAKGYKVLTPTYPASKSRSRRCARTRP